MSKFNELLIEWNAGKPRGGAARLARMLNMARGTISAIARGDEYPSSHLISLIAKAMDLETSVIDACFVRSQYTQQITQSSETAPIPVLGTASNAGFNFSFDLPPIDYLQFLAPHGFFSLKVVVSNMEPLAHINDYLVFRRQRWGSPEDTALIKENGLFRVKKASGSIDILGILTAIVKRP